MRESGCAKLSQIILNKMNLRLEKVYKKNLQILDSIIGLKIVSAIEEQYFFEGKLDEESRGTLKLEFSNGKEFLFYCDSDAESINIQKGGFMDKTAMEAGCENGMYKWKKKEYLSKEKLESFEIIEKTEIEICTLEQDNTQSGCRISFQNGDFLHIWTIISDNIFYGINEEPPYYKKEGLKIELKC